MKTYILGGLLLTFAITASSLGQEASRQIEDEFTGTYEGLDPTQARLVDDWFRRYGEVTGEKIDPREGFNMLPLSTKTTYEAVTHALLTSVLNDEAEQPLGTALDLIEHVETVRGRIEGARGDRQFRVYCRLKDGARDLLERSQQFKRSHDNTVYHKGYPLNYRQQGGVPSIQVSMSLDGRRADIDVDYRSSKFPAALVNGHLTSSNSDIRAGNNFDRHNNRWSGLENWWANWFSLPFVSANEVTADEKNTVIPRRPPKGDGKLQDAVYDFLSSWIVHQKPAVAMSYVSGRSFSCLEVEPGEEADMGMAPFQMLVGMRRVNQALGKVTELGDVLTGIRLNKPELRVVEQPYHSLFALYDLPESVALAFDCASRGLPEGDVPKGSTTRYGKYFGTVLYLEGPGGRGNTLALLWEKEGKDWKIISYLAEPQAEESEIPDLREAIAAGEITRIDGNQQQIAAAKGFLDSWFLDKDYDRVLGYFSDESFACMNLFLKDEEQAFAESSALKERIKLGLGRTVEALGSYDTLGDVISGIESAHPELPIVSHEEESDFALLSVPDFIAGNYGCAYRLSGGESLPKPERPSYGNYYVLAFQTKTFTGEPAILFTLWGNRGGEWKITAFHIANP